MRVMIGRHHKTQGENQVRLHQCEELADMIGMCSACLELPRGPVNRQGFQQSLEEAGKLSATLRAIECPTADCGLLGALKDGGS